MQPPAAMSSQQPGHLHHLPSKEQNLFYILTLVASPLLNLGVNFLVYGDTKHSAQKIKVAIPILHQLVDLSGFLFGLILVLLSINSAQTLLLRHRRARRRLLVFGALSSLYFAVNLLRISYGIYVFNIQSYLLLIISIGVYLSVNVIFLFWYWYVDYPTQIKALRHEDSPREIDFPEQPHGWLPGFLDYLYFTVISSNTLCPPESPSPKGQRTKSIIMLHSLTMMILLVIFVSRAINTLS